MNNDDVKKYIDLSKLYTEVQLDEKKQVDENWFTDKIKEIFGINDAEAEKLNKTAKDAGIDTENPEGEDAKKAGVDNPNIQGNNYATDADGNVTSRGNPVQPGQGGGADQDKPVGKSFADIGQAMLDIKQLKVGDKVTIGDQEAIVTAGPAGNFYTDANGKPIEAAATPDDAGPDTSNADAMASGQAGAAAATTPSNGSLLGRKLDTTTASLMKAYNDGGKKAMPAIRNLQTALSRLGHDPNGLDGKYGQGTFAAVQAFQKANGLSVDGQAGPSTMAAIKKALDDNFEKNKVTPDDTAKDTNAGTGDGTGAGTGDGTGAGTGDEPITAIGPGDSKAGDGSAGDGTGAGTGDGTGAVAGQDKADANPLLSKSAIQQNLERFNILLKKAQESDQAGVPNANADAQQRGVQVASTDFRHLISLVESVLNEALTSEEEKELQMLYKKLQGQVGKSPELDQAIEDALNLYLKVKSPQGKDAGNAPTPKSGKLDDPTTKIPQVVDKKGPDGQYDGDDLGNAPTAPKVSKELYVQMAPNKNASLGNFNVSKMKAKYPKPYIDMPQADGTVHRGYGPLVNLEDFVKNNPKLKAKIIGKPVSPAATYNDKDGTNQQSGKPNANADAQQRSVQTASKDNNMKKAIKEASMNISINGDSAAEVAELAGILKNAGMPNAAPVSDIMAPPVDHGHMDGHDDMVSKMRLMEPPSSDSPCGMDEEGVEEDWDNSPEETYADTQTMTKDLSGGLNRQKKAYPAAQDGDNAMAVETSIKEQLWAALNEKMTAEGDKKRGNKKTLKASRGEKLNASRGDKLMASRDKDKKTTEGSKGKKSRGEKSRG